MESPKKEKRGRKSKQDLLKMATKPVQPTQQQPIMSKINVILHLNCCLKDLKKEDVQTSIDFNSSANNYSETETSQVQHPVQIKATGYMLDKQLKLIFQDFNYGTIQPKQSHCFWCSCGNIEHPVHLPKQVINGTFHIYGHFCSPSCALGYLLREPIDYAKKMERRSLFHQLYKSASGEPFKPAMDPRYLLSKYYGTLSDDDYKDVNSSLNANYVLIDKPVFKLLPDIHEDTNCNSVLTKTRHYKIRMSKAA